MTSLRDIALEAGVSIKTVSNILNGRNKEIWPEAIRRAEKIRNIADRLGYRPNQAARAMRLKRTGQIGVLMTSISNPTSAEVAEHLTNLLAERGYKMLLGLTKSQSERIRSYLSGFANGMVDGVINTDPCVDAALLDDCLGALPHVVWNRDSARSVSSQDYTRDTRVALQHLWDLGHRRIGLLSTQDNDQTGTIRLRVYREFCRERMMSATPALEALMPGWEFCDVHNEVAELLRAGCTAIVGGNDVYAAAAVHALHALRRQVPGEISVIGFDDSLAARMCSPQLTTLRRPVEELSRDAVEALLLMAEGKPLPEFRLRASELILRGTTGLCSAPINTNYNTTN